MPALAAYSLSLLHENKVDEAFAAAQTAVQRRPKDATLTAILGEVEFRRANLKEASAEFQSAVALDPCAARAHYAIVRLLIIEMVSYISPMTGNKGLIIDQRIWLVI